MTLDSYTRKIARKLLCSSDKKKDIIKQIKSDISAKLESGISLDKIIEQMGKPSDVAEEFNENFDEKEKKKVKRKKRLIIAAIVVAVLAVAVSVIYWMLPKAENMEESDVFSEAEVKNKAEYIIDAINEDEFAVVESNMTEDMKAALPAGKLEEVVDGFCDDYGEFKSYGKCYISQVEQRGDKFALAQINVSYENISITYTITFDDNMKLAGIYMK